MFFVKRMRADGLRSGRRRGGRVRGVSSGLPVMPYVALYFPLSSSVFSVLQSDLLTHQPPPLFPAHALTIFHLPYSPS
jgi:hypothetical protein